MCDECEVLRQRVQQAEADAISLRSIVSHEMQMREDAEGRATALSETRTRLLAKHPHELCKFQREQVEAERDAARGKLDKVRDWAHHIRTTRQRGDIEYNAASDVLAILDGKTGD